MLIKPDKDSVLTNLIDAWQTREYKHPVQKIAALQCMMHELWKMAESGDYPDDIDSSEFWKKLNESGR